MKKILTTLFLVLTTSMAWAQTNATLDKLKADPRRAYGNDYPYEQKVFELVCISHSSSVSQSTLYHRPYSWRKRKYHKSKQQIPVHQI